jgi:hypothetical protein
MLRCQAGTVEGALLETLHIELSAMISRMDAKLAARGSRWRCSREIQSRKCHE